MSDAGVMICAMEARTACEHEPDLKQRIYKAMRATRNHWMVTDQAQQFKAAVAAAILESTGEERNRIERSAAALNRLSAMLSALEAGVPVDIDAMEKAPDDVLPLTKMWHDSAEK